jgi:DNA-binding CsgD family transcriptional regulator
VVAMLDTLEDIITPLTNREMQVLSHIAEGNSNKQIAYIIGIREQTIKNHVTAILGKLNANDRAHAVFLAIRNGLIHTEANNSINKEEKKPAAKPFEAGGATINQYGHHDIRFDTITYCEESNKKTWFGQGVAGRVPDDRFTSTSDEDAIFQDESSQALVGALHSPEQYIIEKIEQITQEYRQRRLMEIMNKVDRFIGYLLQDKEKAGIPKQKAVKNEGNPTAYARKIGLPPVRPSSRVHTVGDSSKEHLSLLQAELCLPPKEMYQLRAWRDNANTIKINMLHTDFLASEKDDKRCAWYLFSIWAKQFLLDEYGTDAEALAEEMVSLFSRAGPLLNQFMIHNPWDSYNREVE